MADEKELAKHDCHNGQGGGTKENSGNKGTVPDKQRQQKSPPIFTGFRMAIVA